MNAASLAQKALRKNAWPLKEVAGLTVVQSPLLSDYGDLIHAFTTRLGGQSAAPLNWFNLGRHWDSQESRDDAIANRRLLCGALAVPYDRLTVPGQKHTSNIYVVEPEKASAAQRLDDIDGAVCDQAGLPILLHFADCVPIMIFDPRRKLLAVLHAGWRGTASGITTKGVKMLMDRFRCQKQDLVAAIGPAIGSCCYPTGKDVAAKLSQTVSEAAALVLIREGNPHPDLQAFNAMQLLDLGIENIDVCSFCTCCNPEIFYSHRQSGGSTGRQGAIACIK